MSQVPKAGKSAIQAALEGIHRGMESAAKNAQKITDPNQSENPESIVKAMTDLKQDLRSVEASRKVINTVSEMERELLKIL